MLKRESNTRIVTPYLGKHVKSSKTIRNASSEKHEKDMPSEGLREKTRTAS